MTGTTPQTLVAATEDMIRGAAWLTPSDAPALALLRSLAVEIDREPTAALAGAYGVAYRALIKRAPVAPPPKTGLAAALEEAGAA